MLKRDFSNILAIVLLGAVIYLHAVPAPFHFDDFPHIVHNIHIKNLADLGAIWNHWPSRFFGFLTLAGNYALGGLSTVGYRIFNIVVHLGGAIFAYLLVKLLVSSAGGSSDKGRTIAFWTAIVFACHPVQTQAVTYIVQRFASLAGAFALGAVFCYFKARTIIGSGGRFWSFRHLSLYGGGLFLALLAMTSKESAVAIPVLILSIELFFPRSGVPFARRIVYFMPYALTFAVAPALSLYMAAGRGTNPMYYRLNIAAEGPRMYVVAQDTFIDSRVQYLLTQLHAVLVYLRLSFLPARQSIFYDLPVSLTLFSPGTYISLFVIVGLLILGARLIRRQPLVSLALFWFLLNLAPTSSAAVLWPFISEHHLYLPLFSWSLLVGLCLGWLGERFLRGRLMILAWLLVLCLALLTVRRNYLWGDTRLLWRDALRTAPASAMVYTALAGSLIQDGKYDEAIEAARLAMEINPRIDGSYQNLWAAYFNLGRLEEAETTARSHAEIFPGKLRSLVNLGMTLLKKGEYAAARDILIEAAAKDPASAPAHYWLGVIHYELGEDAPALDCLNAAVAINPDNSGAYDYLGRIYKRVGEGEKGLNAYLRGAGRFPESFLLNYNLAIFAWELGDFELAKRHFERSRRLAGDEKMEKMIDAALSKLQSEMERTEPGAVVLTPEE